MAIYCIYRAWYELGSSCVYNGITEVRVRDGFRPEVGANDSLSIHADKLEHGRAYEAHRAAFNVRLSEIYHHVVHDLKYR